MKQTIDNLRVLSLDGGGSKGFYTLGVLWELERALNKRLCEHFDLIYGTSTGAIIAAMLGLGVPVSEITAHYRHLVPKIMTPRSSKSKSRALNKHARDIFGDQKFDAFQTGVGLVAMNYETQEPLIFKNEPGRAHGMKSSFEAGFGVPIMDAVEASAAACPLFCKKILNTTNKGAITAIDGGFIANNPTLFAMIDATQALKRRAEDIHILSVGVGSYIEKPISIKWMLLKKLEMAQIASKVLVASSNSIEVMTKLLFPNLQIARINDSFPEPQYGTNMVEKDKRKLDKMYQLGLRSYAAHEREIAEIIF